MAPSSKENWSVRKCSKACTVCGKPFADGEVLHSRLFSDAGEYVRHDFCTACWKRDDAGLSSWKTVFVAPVQREEPVRKENAESLLRKLVDRENEEDLNAVFILAVMLERRKILVERDVQALEDGRRVRVYEHRKTNESFMVVDPELRLDELEHVQQQVVALLGGTRPESGSSE